MRILSALGFGARRIIEKGQQTEAIVTAVHTCWWLKINTQPIHTSSSARHPHLVRFSYPANGSAYSGSRFISPQNHPPLAGQRFRLYYDPEHPENYAIADF